MPELARYAVTEKNSAGRRYKEAPHQYRSDFERDRDRIIHSQAFRRLEGKTQVFTPGLDDSYRNRLTHTIEVAQIGRTISKALSLNESLTEAICLGHDLGHCPFGHAGEEALDKLATGFGGFEHNKQTLRIVDVLEHPYPGFRGLNLMYEARLGFAKHRSPYDKADGIDLSQKNCSLEGQVADVADRIAYNCHDLEDGMRASVINEGQLREIRLFAEAWKRIGAERIADSSIRRTRTAKAIIDKLVSEVIRQSNERIADFGVEELADVYAADENVIRISNRSEEELKELEFFLLNEFYLSNAVQGANDKIYQWFAMLFDRYIENPQLLPIHFQELIRKEGLRRTVCDYIAGMTDRYCLKMVNYSG